MIKGIVQNENGKSLLVIGLSDLNIERLRAGNDVYTKLDKLGLPNVELLISTGAVEEDIISSLNAKYGLNVGSDTDVTGPYKPEAS